mmetsp:Transcript_14612/g.32216  ORF Transcript_14612/g.32216 Transcript_14612/m.32216 type:complete len:384 (-) Transcript_14612:1303-2454(-)
MLCGYIGCWCGSCPSNFFSSPTSSTYTASRIRLSVRFFLPRAHPCRPPFPTRCRRTSFFFARATAAPSSARAVHMWHKRSFFLIREQMCGRESCAQHEGLPISTAETKCKVPIFPRDTEEAFRQQVDAWCHEEYQSENCYDILHAAQQKFLLVTKAFYCVNIAIGFFLVVLLYLTMRSLREVISRPIVQRSTIANIPAGFIVPIIGSLYMAFLLLSKNSIVEHQQYCGWIGKVYLVSAGTFFIAALLSRYIAMASVMNCADKKRKKISVFLFILTMMLAIIIVVSIFVTSVVVLVMFKPESLEDKDLYTNACRLDVRIMNCSNCTKGHEICPQWSKEQVVGILRTNLKMSAISSLIALMYAFSGVGYGFVLRDHISTHQIDYV